MLLPPGKTAIVIVGPTAAGKTSVSLSLASQLNTSIISADSRQCFRELNIGVAKPNNHELQLCQHYFVNSHSIFDKVDTVVFEKDALAAAKEIFSSRDKLIVSGGTGLYVKVFCEGIDALPEISPEIRKKVMEAIGRCGTNRLPFLQTWLSEIDPTFLASTHEKENPVRLMRAIEVKLASGRSIMDFRKGHKQKRDFNIIKIGLNWPRERLYERINSRVDKMMEDGLLKEVTALYPHRDLPALQTVGYQEIFEYMDGKYTLEEAVEKIKQHSRNYAKRQMTWFRRDEEITWIDMPEGMDELVIQ
jgi:tRNA dimethylallyltransferase